MMSILQMPIELVSHIRSYLTLKERAFLHQTCSDLFYMRYSDHFYYWCRYFFRGNMNNLFRDISYISPSHAQILYTMYPNKFDTTLLFFSTAVDKKNGYLLADFLYRKSMNLINLRDKNDHIFREACIFGNFNLVKWLLAICPKFMENEYTYFMIVCKFKYLELAKFFFQNYPTINIRKDHDLIFRTVCSHGHIDIAKWLLKVVPEINIRAENDYAFIWACCGNHFKLAMWLKNICPDINVRSRNDFVFRMAYRQKNTELIQYLCTVEPAYIPMIVA